MKGLFALPVLFLLLLLPGAALAEEVTVTASGKDAATAELNARVVAVRQVLQETAAMDFLLSKMDMVRKEFILKSRDFTSTVTVLSSEEEQGVVRITATVATDRDKIRQRLLGIDPKAVASAPAVTTPVPETSAPQASTSKADPVPQAAALEPTAPAKKAEPAPQAAAVPSDPALPDEEFLTMLVMAAPLEERLAAIRNGANPNAAPADWEMSNRIMQSVYKDGRIKKAASANEKDAVFPGKTALMLVADDYLSTEQEAIAVMEALVAAGADINARDYSGRNVLMYMQKHLRPDFFAAFLAHKPDLEAVMDKPQDGVAKQNSALSGRLGGSGSTPLLYSVYPMVPDEVKPVARKSLLLAGADPNKKTDEGYMILPVLAAGSTDLELFTLALERTGPQSYHSTMETLMKHPPERENRNAMLEALLKIDTEDKNWKQAGLYEACKKFESPDMIRLFLKYGTDPNAKQSLGYTLLMLNTIDPRSVPPLVEAGANVNERHQGPIKNKTPLMFALEAEKPDLALALLAAGADPNLEAERGLRFTTALQMEVDGKGRVELVKALLDAGARMDVTDSRGYSLLHVASAGGGGAPVLELLKEKGLDVMTVEKDGDSALFHAARANKADIVEWLVRAGVDVNRATDKGKTALHAALEHWRGEEATKALIRAGADVNAVCQEYGAPLFMAAGIIYPEAVKPLLESGADVNLPGRGGQTPLMRAVQNSYVPVVALLLDAGADISLKDEKGKAAWDLTEGSRIWENPEYDEVKQRLKPQAQE